MKNNTKILLGVTLSLLITWTLRNVLNGKRATNSVFQHIFADTYHHTYLSVCCSIIKSVNTFCTINLNLTDKINGIIIIICATISLSLVWCYGRKMLDYLVLGFLTIVNVWLLARWCDDFYICYSLDIFTIYLLVWQFTYLIYKWCSHQLSLPNLVFYQLSICILSSIEAFMFYDIFLRYFPFFNIVSLWIISVWDIFQCFHINGRFRNEYKEFLMNCSMGIDPKFPSFCFYTHDFQNGTNNNKYGVLLGGGDLLMYNILLLWILPPLSSIETQLLILIIFIINIEISRQITDWIGCLWNEYLLPAVPIPVIFVSGYSIILYFIIEK